MGYQLPLRAVPPPSMPAKVPSGCTERSGFARGPDASCAPGAGQPGQAVALLDSQALRAARIDRPIHETLRPGRAAKMLGVGRRFKKNCQGSGSSVGRVEERRQKTPRPGSRKDGGMYTEGAPGVSPPRATLRCPGSWRRSSIRPGPEPEKERCPASRRGMASPSQACGDRRTSGAGRFHDGTYRLNQTFYVCQAISHSARTYFTIRKSRLPRSRPETGMPVWGLMELPLSQVRTSYQSPANQRDHGRNACRGRGGRSRNRDLLGSGGTQSTVLA